MESIIESVDWETGETIPEDVFTFLSVSAYYLEVTASEHCD